jgi:hypothetical protein
LLNSCAAAFRVPEVRNWFAARARIRGSSRQVVNWRRACVLRVGEGLDLAAVPALEQEDLPVDGDQRAGGHEQVAQVGGGAPARQVKQGLVAERDVPPCARPRR